MRINLFCLPFAGGSSYAFKTFEKFSTNWVNVIPIELPGRGRRIKERLLFNAHDIVDDIFDQIKDALLHPYAIYGHSMGSLLGYLLTIKIIFTGLRKPERLFFSGSIGPSAFKFDPPRYNLPRESFFKKIMELGGLPESTYEDEAVLDFFEPILRADFQSVETYTYRQNPPFDIPINLFIGDKEKVTRDEILSWKNETTQEVELDTFKGNHFFIFNYEAEIMKIIHSKLIK
ncbi:MAG: alpha/beta fold hydrolase [Cytophagales bacterium]|nr:alpha/beta fold hydrolase [Cytophagales bacterium]